MHIIVDSSVNPIKVGFHFARMASVMLAWLPFLAFTEVDSHFDLVRLLAPGCLPVCLRLSLFELPKRKTRRDEKPGQTNKNKKQEKAKNDKQKQQDDDGSGVIKKRSTSWEHSASHWHPVSRSHSLLFCPRGPWSAICEGLGPVLVLVAESHG